MTMLARIFLSTFLATVFLLQWWQRATYPPILWIALGSIGGITLIGLPRKSLRVIASILLSITIGLIFALWSVSHSIHVPDETSVEQFANQKNIIIEGIVAAQPDDRQTKLQYTIETRSIQISKTGSSMPIHGRILLIDRSTGSKLQPGDLVRIPGKLAIPLENEEFSYKAFLALSDIHATIDAREIEIIKHTNEYRLIHILWQIRSRFERRIATIFPEPSASLLAGLLTGTKQGLPETITAAFRTTGLSHIVAISGSNITIIIGIVTGALFFLPLRWRLIPSIIAIILFTMFVGAGASVIRASIMGVIGIVALHTGRLPNARLAVLWTAFFMLLLNPAQLWLDAGFQLSFLAVIGLIELQPIILHYCSGVPQAWGMRDALITTIAAQLTAMPWSAFRFGLFSLISPVANIFISPLIPLSMLFGFMGTIAGFIHPLLGKIIGLPAALLLESIIVIAETCAAVPHAAITLPKAGFIVSAGYYVFLIIGTIMQHKRLPTV